MTTFVLTTAGRNAACNGFVDAVDAGTGNGDLVLKDATVTVSTINFGATAFGNAATGVASLTASVTGATVAAAGTVDSFDLRDSAQSLATGDAGATGATLTISGALATTDTVDLTAFTVTVPAS